MLNWRLRIWRRRRDHTSESQARHPITKSGILVIAILFCVLIAASVSIAPTVNSPSTHADFLCSDDVLISDAPGVAARGTEDFFREPTELNEAEEVPATERGKAGRDFRATVPTYVHVVTPDGVEANVPLSKIREQIRVLDQSFAGFYGGPDTGFDFDLVSVDRVVNADWYYAGPTTKPERDMKQALHQGGPNALNIYLTTAGPYLGWSYFPSILQSQGQAYLDGIVIDWKSLPGMGFYPSFDLGFTATHETGHWLNLYHTFQGGCNHFGDYVEDTPPQRTPSFGCPEGKDTCADPGLDPIHNFMDYSDDPCYTEFTKGQSERMQDAWLFWRA